MTKETIKKANKLQDEISRLECFISALERNRTVRLFNKWFKKDERKNISCTISDYMRPYEYYELSKTQRDKMIAMLQEEYDEKVKELDNLA